MIRVLRHLAWEGDRHTIKVVPPVRLVPAVPVETYTSPGDLLDRAFPEGSRS